MSLTTASATSEGRWLGVLCLLGATCAWGGLFHTGKHALAYLDPFWFTAVRYAGATLLLTALLAAQHGIQLHRVRKHAFRLFAYGMLGYGMFGIMVFVGLSHSVPSHGAIIMATMPLTSLFIRWGFDGQRPQWWAWAAGLVAMLGVSLVSGIWTAASDAPNTVQGDLVAYAGTLGWILYTRGQQTVPHLKVVEYTAYTAILALPGLLAVAIAATLTGHARFPGAHDLMQAAPAMLYIVIAATVLAALAFNQGVRRLGPTHGIVFINMVPVSALLISAAQGDVPSAMELAGTGLVVAGLLTVARRIRAS